MTNVKFDRGSENRYGNRVYFSKDGLFMIEQRKYQLPTSSTGYTLSLVQPAPAGLKIPKCWQDNESLADAKAAATYVIDECVISSNSLASIVGAS